MWSIPSIEEAPELEKIWQAYQEEGVLVLGINQADVETYALRFLEENGVTYPTGPDTGADIATSLGSAGVPETYVLDREGKVAHIIIGPSTYDELSETIESILRE